MPNPRQKHHSQRETTIKPDPPVTLYLDNDPEKINPEMLDKLAAEKADQMEPISSSQLRRFFGEMKGLYNRLQNGESFTRLLPLVKIMKSKAYYACDRNKIKRPFAGFIIGAVEQIHTESDFRAVVMYLEAVVGFMYGKGKVRN